MSVIGPGRSVSDLDALYSAVHIIHEAIDGKPIKMARLPSVLNKTIMIIGYHCIRLRF